VGDRSRHVPGDSDTLDIIVAFPDILRARWCLEVVHPHYPGRVHGSDIDTQRSEFGQCETEQFHVQSKPTLLQLQCVRCCFAVSGGSGNCLPHVPMHVVDSTRPAIPVQG